jgi:hypothetical protein
LKRRQGGYTLRREKVDEILWFCAFNFERRLHEGMKWFDRNFWWRVIYRSKPTAETTLKIEKTAQFHQST